MLPQLFSFGPIHLYSYGLMLALAFYAGATWLWRDARVRGWDENHVATLSLLMLVVSVIGARALFVFTHWGDYAADPVEALRIWRGGLTLYGGILLAIPTGIAYCVAVKLPLWQVADAFAAPLALGMALGRVGCFLNGCCYGLPTRLPWGVTFPPTAYSSIQFPGHHLHPSQLYVTFGEFALMGLLLALRSRLRPGQLWWLFVMLDSVIRFAVDYTRYYEPSAYVAPHFALSQAMSTGLFAAGLVMYALLGRSGAPARSAAEHARVDPAAALYGVAGWPLRHTSSPGLHNAAFTALGLAAAYVPLRVKPAQGAYLVHALDTLGFSGANVTVPHKEAAFRQCEFLSEDALAARSVNTLVRTPRGWQGHTTDGEGFVDFLGSAGFDPAGARVALLGSGGAARSVAVALLKRPRVRVRLVTRDPRRAARALTGVAEVGRGSSLELLRRGEGARAAVASARLVVNATTLGSGRGARLPCPAAWIGSGALAVDMVYGAPTPWLRALRRRNVVAFGGLGMLIHQAARSFELWTGRKALTWMKWTGGWEREVEFAGAGAPVPATPGRSRR